MQKIKHWLAGIGLAIASLFGYHSQIQPTSVIETVKPEAIASPTPSVEIISPKIDSKRVSVSCDSTCTQDEKNALNRIVDKMMAIQASNCFSNYIKEPSTMLDAGQLNMLTIDQAIKKVITSRVNTTLTYYYQSRNWFTKTLVIGYENGDGKIHANRAAWDYMSDCEKASNLGHELSHQLGFHHDFERTARRPYSLPYVIGDAVLECCK